jgi:periplasmic divalent cation tolerance protein
VSPYPMDVARAVGPIRLVLSTYPSRETAVRATHGAVERRLAACGTLVAVDSHFWWKGAVVEAGETLVLFKTAPKRVGALFAYLRENHPYEVPEILEVDVPRVDDGYLAYLARTIDTDSPPPPLGAGPTRRGAPRDRATRAPVRTRARRLRPSK